MKPDKHSALIQKLWKDKKFKEEFLKDLKKHLGEAYGAKLPDDIQIEVYRKQKENIILFFLQIRQITGKTSVMLN
jgi:hypothetical protein